MLNSTVSELESDIVYLNDMQIKADYFIMNENGFSIPSTEKTYGKFCM